MNQIASVNNEGLSTFIFSGKEVRVVGTPEIPMFVAKDIVDAVSAVWNGSAAISHIPDDFKGVRSVLTPSGEQKMLCLTEAGLNMYLFRSDKPAALPFQRKIAEEVLPSIRKHGVFATPQTIESMLADPDFAIQTFQKLKEERTRRIAAEEEAGRAKQSLQAEESSHRVTQGRLTSLRDKLDALINSNGKGILIRDAAKFLQCNGYPSCKESLLRASLQAQKWLTKGHRVTATEKAIKGKVLTVGDGPIVNYATGWEGVPITPRVTGKGMVWIVAHMGDLGFHKEPDCDDLTINLEID